MNEKFLKNRLSKLILMKKEGKSETEEYLNLLERLKEYIKHYDEEIRLKTLGLIAESKKSTMKFLPEELNIVILFLGYNLGERIEYVPLIKKILKRWADSLALMRREILQEKKMRSREKNVNMSSEIYEQALAASHSKCDGIEKEIEIYLKFSSALHDTCIDNLYPDATYSRRKSSLNILCLMEEFLDQSTNFSWNSVKAGKVLTCLLLDTYESNKDMAYKIIKSIDPILLNLDSKEQVCKMINTAIELGNGIRPIDSITAMYLFKIALLSPKILDFIPVDFQIEVIDDPNFNLILLILERLETILTQARQNVVTTITKHSIYGYVFCIRSLLNDCDFRKTSENNSLWRELFGKVIPLCFELNKAVSIIVNDSSPEGHLPLNFSSSQIEKNVVTPQVVLLCSWRTVKEVSLLFGQLVAQVSTNDISDYEILTKQQIIDIGNHLVGMLRETKHRGAFEQTHVGLQQLCACLWRSNREDLNKLPSIWLYQILIEIADLGPENSKLCATRRSAGVPFMIQALIASAPDEQFNEKISISHSLMNVLLRITELKDDSNDWNNLDSLIHDNPMFSEMRIISQETEERVGNIHLKEIKVQENEIKTHSLNVLRALFRHHRLEDLVKTYVSDGLMVALNSYNGKTWAERNAATMLFSALVIRIFGVQRTKDHVNLTIDNRMSGKLFFERYPKLLSFVLNELKNFLSLEDTLKTTNVHPILHLLSRLYRNSNGQTDAHWKIDELVKLVSECARSRVYYTRQLAARALLGLLNETSGSDLANELMRKIVKEKKNLTLNQLHGYMLQLLEIVKGFRLDNNNVSTFIIETKWMLNDSICFSLAMVYVNFLSEIFKTHQTTIETFDFKYILSTLTRHLTDKDILRFGPGQGSYKIAAIGLIVLALKIKSWESTNIPRKIYTHILEDSDEEIQMTAWNTLPRVLEQSSTVLEKTLFYTQAIVIVRNRIKSFYSYNPDLQDTIFNFLYTSLTDETLDDHSYRFEICRLVLIEMRQEDQQVSYRGRCSFIRLLGKSYATASKEFKEETMVDQEYKRYIYDLYFNTWINQVDTEFRISVLDVMQDLFYVCKDDQDDYSILKWWTTVLKLLIDDDATTRRQVSQFVSRIEPKTELECHASTFDTFLNKFYQIMAVDQPGLAIVAFFYWSIGFSIENDYAMDETEVFNKCKNHDCLEPVQISNRCIDLINKIITTEKTYSINDELPIDGINWLNSIIDIDITEKTSLERLINQYQTNIPNLNKPLEEILDPTYKDKLITFLACEKYSHYFQTHRAQQHMACK